MGIDKPLLCRLGVHRFVDFPDPNPESGGLEKQGYRACTRCSKEKDKRSYVSRSGHWDMAPRQRVERPPGQPLDRRPRRQRTRTETRRTPPD